MPTHGVIFNGKKRNIKINNKNFVLNFEKTEAECDFTGTFTVI